MTLLAPDRLAAAERLGLELVHAWGSWGPTMTPDAARTAFISDRGGSPEVWVQDVASDGEPPAAHCIRFTDDPVLSVSWSADSAWLACLVATDGGVRTQVWVVRPDGSDARRIAGSRDAHAEARAVDAQQAPHRGHRPLRRARAADALLPRRSRLR